MKFNENQLAAIKKALAELHKAAPEIIPDVFEDFHRVPAESEYETGPGEAASGGGAEKMIREYSDVARQVALAEEYNKVANMLKDFPAMKSQINDIYAVQSALLTTLVAKGRNSASISKALENALIELGSLKATKAKASAIRKAEQKIKDLRSDLAFLNSLETSSLQEAIKAVASKVKAEEEEEEHDGHEEEEHEEHKAESEEEEEEEEEEHKKEEEKSALDKAISEVTRFMKADEKEEEEMMKEADEEKKAKFTALKAIKKANESHDAGGKFAESGEHKDKKKEEEEESAKSLALKNLTKQVDEIKKSLDSFSVGGNKVPAFKDGEKNTVVTRVLKALEEDALPQGSDISARSLLNQLSLVEAGHLAKNVFDNNLKLAPASVQSLFVTE